MSLAWYAKRLASMSLPEVVHRIGEQAKRSTSRRRPYGWQAFKHGGSLRPIPGLCETFKAGVSAALAARIRAAADVQIDGHFKAHGVTWPQRASADSFPADVWRLDPITARLWPGDDEYCFDLEYRHRRDLGDIKYVWDLNRLQFLQPLAAAVALWQDQRALATLQSAIASWAQHNPPFRGLAWNSGIELALRAVSLVFVASLCGEHLCRQTQDQIAAILRAHLYWLGRFPSRFSSANNHLVAEALGEFVIASVLSDTGSDEIATRARAILEREATLQIHPDGTGAEQSPNYGAFTAEMLLVASTVARAFGYHLDSSVNERLQAFAEFIAWISDARGTVPNIGDDDEGRVLTLCTDHEQDYPASIARAIAGHLGSASRLPDEREAPELRDAFFPPASDAAPAPEGARTFEVGGYSVIRETRAGRRVRLVVDHGPLGYLAIAAHGHADANALTLSLDDEEIFVDPGTFLYHSGGEWRNWFRSTMAHNTLAVEGLDQSIIAGPFNWSHKAKGWIDAFEPGDSWSITASHDGYCKRLGTQHRRTLRATQKGFVMTDALPEANRPLNVEATLQLAPGLDVSRDGVAITIRRDDRQLLRILFSEQGEIATIRGGDHAHGGWVSRAFGYKDEACRLVWRGLMPPGGLRTEFTWA